MSADSIIDGARLLVTLGFEVYKAIKSGDHARTVGQIFEDVGADLEYLEDLEAEHFGDR